MIHSFLNSKLKALPQPIPQTHWVSPCLVTMLQPSQVKLRQSIQCVQRNMLIVCFNSAEEKLHNSKFDDGGCFIFSWTISFVGANKHFDVRRVLRSIFSLVLTQAWYFCWYYTENDTFKLLGFLARPTHPA